MESNDWPTVQETMESETAWRHELHRRQLAEAQRCEVCHDKPAHLRHGLGYDRNKPPSWLCEPCWNNYYMAMLEYLDTTQEPFDGE